MKERTSERSERGDKSIAGKGTLTGARSENAPVIDEAPPAGEAMSVSIPTGKEQESEGRQDLGRFENKYTFLPTGNGHLIRHLAPDYGRLAPKAGV